jgi:putative Holliday junction resolvase
MNTAAVPEADQPEGRQPPWPEGTWLGFDFGLRRIGVASGQTATGTAGPLDVVAHGNRAPDWPHLQRLLKEWRPVGVVVGLPLGKDGEETPMSRRARAFGKQLALESRAVLAFCDERLSSHAAGEQFAAQRAGGSARRKDAAKLDAKAAAIILENWLQSLSHE